LNSDDKGEVESLEGDNSKTEDMDVETLTDPEPGKKARKKLKQKQQDEEIMTAEKRARMEAETEITPAVFLKQTWTDIQASADKLFMIKRPHDINQNNPASWHLAQVDVDERNYRQAKTIGECHVKHCTRNFTGAKKKLVRHCRHWSLIRKITQPSGNFGDIIVLRPSKVEETLAKKPRTRGWHQGTVNLAEQGLVGPFNFLIDPPGQFLIHQATWMALEAAEEVEAGRVDIANLNQITPLR
jgi:hypothetical protein